MFASMAMNTREYAESGDAGALDFGSEQRRAFGDSGPERKGHRTKRSSARSGTKRSPTVEPMDLTRPSGGGG
jgi:hypothetical protein